jgi:predicted ferric reductase
MGRWYYTSELPKNIHVGQRVTVEGPYGRFKFDPYPALLPDNQTSTVSTAHQIWIAGGIGITPFLSRLQMIAESAPKSDSTQHASNTQHLSTLPITLYYCTRVHDSSFVKALHRLSSLARINLHIIASDRDQPLTAEKLKQDNPMWLTAHFWFCGPAGLGQSLRDALVAQGLKSRDFHQELFEMR